MRFAAVLALVSLSPLGCAKHGGAPAPSASAPPGGAERQTGATPAVASASGSTSAVPAPAAGPPAVCRAMSVQGAVVTASGKALAAGAELDAAGWIAAPAGSRLAVKNTATTRELVFDGPASLLACERGEERFLLTSGDVHTATWAGARPGAEVLLGTPFGALRYGDAKLDVHVDDKGLLVTSEAGDAWVERPRGGGEEKIPAGKRKQFLGHAPDVKGLVADCEKRAEDAETRARAVLAPGRNAAPLGTRAAEHVRARKAARASCAIAAAAVETAQAGAGKDELRRRVTYADARWRSVP